MATYLLTWNPKKYDWNDIQDCIKEIKNKNYFYGNWSCSRTKKINKGDRIFMIRLGKEPKGIFASGWSDSNFYEYTHWDEIKEEEGKKALYIDIKLDILLNPDNETILARKNLNKGILSKMCWNSQSSGISISDEVAKELEKIWSELLKTKYLLDIPLPEEVVGEYIEGSTKQIRVNIYERNPHARKRCIEYYGTDCCVCGFNFEKVYGSIGNQYIHVHHIKPLSEIGTEYKIDPIKDLRPICPNCHTMLHKGNPILTIEDLKKNLQVLVPKLLLGNG